MAISTIKRTISDSIYLCSITGQTNSSIRIINGAIFFTRVRNPVFCVYTSQHGVLNIFVIFTGQNKDSTPTITSVEGTTPTSVTISDNDLIIEGVGNWGVGYAIGLV